MGSQQFCLRWNNHQMNMLNVFDQLLHNGDFVDVTLSCSGGAIKAHKMVLSACSPYFQELFRDNPCKHPIVILKDMKMLELRSIVDFMYKGEINVSQDQLPTLLKTAESLKVKGLAEVSSSGSGSGSSADQQTANSSSPARDDGSLVPTSNGTGGVQRFAGGEGSAQSDGRMSPHPKRKRHRPARRQSNDDSNNEDAEEKNDVSKDGSKSTMLKSEPLEVNEPQIELLMDDEQFPRLDASINDQERNANDVRDGNSRLSQSDIMEMSQPSTSGAHGASGGPSTAKLSFGANSGSSSPTTTSTPPRSANYIPWVRSPCRSGPCKTWQEETMFTAVRAVLKMGVPLIHASRRYGIPYPTLFYYTSRVRHLLKPEDNSGEEGSASELQVSGNPSPFAHGTRYYHHGHCKITRATGRRGRPTKIYLGTWPDEDLTRAIVRVVYRDYMPEQLESILSSSNFLEGEWSNPMLPRANDGQMANVPQELIPEGYPPVEANFTESEDSATSTKDVGTEMLMPDNSMEESGSAELWPHDNEVDVEPNLNCPGQSDTTEIDLTVPL